MEPNKQLVTTEQKNLQLATITNSDLLIVCSPGKAVEVFSNVKTIADIFKPEHKTPSLFRLRKEVGQQALEAYIKIWLVDLTEFLNVSRGMNESQIDATAATLIQTFGYLTLADIYYVFNNAKLGKFKMMYERLDGQIILQWFDTYFNERCELAESISITEHFFTKKDLVDIIGEERTSQDLRPKIKRDIENYKTSKIIEADIKKHLRK